MERYADVSLPVNLDREFTYLIPPGLEHAALIGTRAVVPFGRKYATGLITGLPARTSVTGLKPIHDIIDPAPIVSDELLRLCRWIAAYYLAPLGSVLKAAMPQGFSPSSKRIVRALPALTPAALEELKARAPKQAEAASFIMSKREASASEVQKKTGARQINALLNELVRGGLVGSEEQIPGPAGKPKFVEIVRRDLLREEALREAIASLPPRRKKVRGLLESLIAAGTGPQAPTQVRDLLRHTGATLTQFRELAASGLVVTERIEVSREQDFGTELQTLGILLNDSQKEVLDALTGAMERGHGGAYLIHGVTGSGKTQVYIEAIRSCLALGRTAIVLVPEISLTPQMVRRFKSHFGDDVAVVHSRMSPGERHDAWRRGYRGEARIVIGPRSAVFAPLSNLGLIVVDEEHESSYKQFDSSPRYHARDVAVVRGGHSGAVVVLGSATPSVESFSNAESGKYTLLRMPRRIDNVPMPSIAIVDMTAERKHLYAAMKESLPPDQRAPLKNFVQPSISGVLRGRIQDRLERREGIILLQNRRGFAPFVECAECGYAEMCDNCNVSMTYHLTKKHLRCHYCGLIRKPTILCPTCGGSDIKLRGIGTQKVEEDLARLFPGARVLRMDMDSTTRKGAHDRILRTFAGGEADILLGTQMVAKGLDFPRVTLVGVISADTQMLLPDFRASERTFQLLTQVAGRAGRSVLKGEVLIQTHQPGHYTLVHVLDHDFMAFYEEELRSRRELAYPPFSRLVLVETRGENEDHVRVDAERFALALRDAGVRGTLLGPAPAVIGKIDRKYRWHLILKCLKEEDPSGSAVRGAIHAAIAKTGERFHRDVQRVIDVDPAGLM
jgi:primosomal protein N' (replication factor Y) (superfamily II helicase)